MPIWLGGNHPRQLRRAGRLADGYLANPAMLDTLEADWDLVRSAAEEAGRDPAALKLGINRITMLADDGLEQAAQDLAAVKERGFDHAIAGIHPAVRDAEALLHKFAADYLPALQG